MTVEEWRPAPGLEGRYEVSSLGRVRCITRRSQVSVRKPNPAGRYDTVCVYVHPGRHNFPVHVLVCEAFHGAKPEWATCVRHLNDEKRDNRAANLAWGTHADNMQDRTRNGRCPEANRDACDRGHPYVDGDYSIFRGYRRCLVCHRDRERARKATLRAARVRSVERDGQGPT